MRRCYVFILVWAAVGCSGPAVLERIVDHDDDAFARAYFDSVRFSRLDYAVKALSPALSQVPRVRDSLARLAVALPHGAVDSVHLIGASRFHSPSMDRTAFTYEYHSARGWGAAMIAVDRELGLRYIGGMRADTLPRSLEAGNAFTLRGKGAGHLLMLAMVLACFGTSLAGVVAAIRTPMRRRWLWALLSVVGAGVFSFNWTTGESGLSFVSLLLFAASMVRRGVDAPWILQAAFPVGALMTFRRVQRARVSVVDAARSAPGAERTERANPISIRGRSSSRQ